MSHLSPPPDSELLQESFVLLTLEVPAFGTWPGMQLMHGKPLPSEYIFVRLRKEKGRQEKVREKGRKTR